MLHHLTSKALIKYHVDTKKSLIKKWKLQRSSMIFEKKIDLQLLITNFPNG
jgi:hypothetical protein